MDTPTFNSPICNLCFLFHPRGFKTIYINFKQASVEESTQAFYSSKGK